MNRPPQTASKTSTSTDSGSPPLGGGPPQRSLSRPARDHATAIARQSGIPSEHFQAEPNSLAEDTQISPAGEWAESGAMALSGDPSGPPQFAAGALASAARGAEILLRALAPAGAFADLDGPALLGERAAIAGLRRGGEISCGGAARLLPTKSGFIAAHLPRDSDWQSMPAWLEVDEDSMWRFPTESDAELRWTRLAEIVREHPVETLLARGRLLGLAVAPAAKQIPQNTPLFRATHLSERRPMKHLVKPNSEAGTERPLRLLDLSSLWAGPLAASLLAECGIEVLKIESPDRPDGARLGPARFFDLMQGGKAGCALDLRSPSDRLLFEALLEQADLVIESARPRALEQLGYDAGSWVQAEPGRIWASITGYGRSDPGVAFGDDAAVAAGLAWSPTPLGETAERPSFCADAVADPLTGLHTAALVLGWLRKGRGALLDFSLRDVAANAACVTDSELTAPLHRRESQWVLALPETEIPVSPPRARKTRSSAPPLLAPTQELIQHWTEPC